MAALTWRDVAAPDFNTALAGYGVAGRNITDAGAAMSKGIGDFQADQQNTAAAQLAAAASKFTDQKSLEAATQNGSLLAQSGANPGYLTADAYKIPDNRATTLLAQATSQQSLDHNTAMSPLLQKNEAANTASLDSSTAGKNIANDIALAGKQDAIDVAHQTALQHPIDIKHGNTTWDDAQAATAVKVNGDALANLAARGVDPNDPNAAINNMNAIIAKDAADAKTEKREPLYDPNTVNYTLSQLKGQIAAYNPTAPGQPSGSALPSQNNATKQLNDAVNAGQAASSAAADKVLTEIPYNETRKYVSNVYVPGGDNSPDSVWGRMVGQESGGKQFDSNGNPLTSSKGAKGAAQVTEDTGPEAAKYAGVAWDKNKWANDRDYNLKIGRAYFDHMVAKYDGNTAVAAAAYNAGPGAVDSWNLAESHKGMMSTASQQVAGATAVAGQNASIGVNSTYKETQADAKSTPGAIASGLITNDPRFKDADNTAVSNQISSMLNESKVNGIPTMTAATAGSLLSRFGGQHLFNSIIPRPLRSIAIQDEESYKNALNEIKTNVTNENTGQQAGLAAASSQLQTVTNVADAAFSEYARLDKQVRDGRTDLQPARDKALEKYQSAKLLFQTELNKNPLGLVNGKAPDKNNPTATPNGKFDFVHAPTQAAIDLAAAAAKAKTASTPTAPTPNGAAPALAAAAGDNKPFDIGYAALHGLGNVVSAQGKARRIVTGVAGAGLSGLNEVLQGSPEHVLAQAQSMDDSSPLKQRIIAAQLKRIADREKQGN